MAEGRKGGREGKGRKEGRGKGKMNRRERGREGGRKKGRKEKKIICLFSNRKLWLVRPHDMLTQRYWFSEKKMGFGIGTTQL